MTKGFSIVVMSLGVNVEEAGTPDIASVLQFNLNHPRNEAEIEGFVVGG